MVVKSGEIASVWGERRSERLALLRVAAGIDLPNAGSVRADGRLVFARPSWPTIGGPSVLGQLILPLLAGAVSIAAARSRALAALVEWDLEGWSARNVRDLEEHELTRLSLIRALVTEPEIMLVDEPILSSSDVHAPEIMRILHAARERGVATLLTTSAVRLMRDADGLYTLDDGVLRGLQREPAPVVPFPRRKVG
jgi:putative ABC transport system ATP-binding protein